jgi:hypothetical protein
MACQAGEPWTAESPNEEHGHYDCWLYHSAADLIEKQEFEIRKLKWDLGHKEEIENQK